LRTRNKEGASALFLLQKRRRKMTLEEAIKHSLEIASEASCDKCKSEHLQLVSWLQELQQYRKKKDKNIIKS
jgi:hypothetical protein